MLFQKPKSVDKKPSVKACFSPIKNKEEYDLDNLLKKLNSIKINEPKLDFPFDFPMENEQKSLSILKKEQGVLDYFQEIKKDKEKSSIPRYLNDITINILYLKRCQDIINKCYIRLPIIVIDQVYYYNFKNFLSYYYQYKKYKDNRALIEFLILGTNEIKNYKIFHEINNSKFAAECISTGLITHYDFDKIFDINKKIQSFFKNNDIDGIDIDIYYDKWINDVMDIFFNYILFICNQSPEVIKCDKCKKIAIFTKQIIFNSSIFIEGSLCKKIYEDMENNETYPKSIDIANNMVNHVDFSQICLNKKDNIKKDDTLLNIIYYDEGINNHRNEIIDDSLIFEKECNGTLLLVTNIKSMLLILKDIKKCKEVPTFHLICSGSAFENLMKYLQQYNKLYKYIKTIIIYTYNYNKYSYLLGKYDIVKGIFTGSEEIIDYIRKNKSNKNIKYKVPILITYNKYNEKYIEFHKIISSQYAKLYQKSSYLTALNILEEHLISTNEIENCDIQLLLKTLEVFSRGPRDYKKIINEYTNESFYSLFNKWLNQIDPLAIRKIAFFISGLQLSLNIYGKMDKKGFNYKSEIYRGALFNYSHILSYERNIGNIITYPSFFSTTLDIQVAKEFSQYNLSKENRGGLFSTNYIIRINPKSDWISQGFNITNISTYKNEKEILFQPFCFFWLTKVNVDLKNNLCFIYLELIGKKEIWEKRMNINSTTRYQNNDNFIELIHS